jgi:hypothetical protein
MGSDMTMVVTCCDAGDGVRHSLLKRTLDSFIAVNCGGMKPDRCIIIEDGPATLDSPSLAWLKNEIHFYSANVGKVEFLSNGVRRGQTYSIDRAYALVNTTWIYHCEEDWLHQGNTYFLQQSKDILLKYSNIWTVSLRGTDCNGHPLIDFPPFEGFKIQMPMWKGFGSINWNPGLRRLSDYKRIGSYGKHMGYGVAGLDSERNLSRMHHDMGYRIAALPPYDKPYVVHIGGGFSRSAGYTPTAPKILIAVPACDVFDYKKWESSDSPHYNRSTNFNGEPYGTDIHISHIRNERIEAVRETWVKDVAKFPTATFKFFYGKPFDRQPLADEVVLDVPSDYEHLSHRTIAICKYAKENGFDWLVKADDDTAIWVDRLMHEIVGFMGDYGGYANGRVASGGPSYILSKRAFTLIADKANAGTAWAEDVMTSKTLFAHNIQLDHLEGHKSGKSQHWFFGDKFDTAKLLGNEVAIHAVRPADLRAWYAQKETNGRS